MLRLIPLLLMCLLVSSGCSPKKPPYGRESRIVIAGKPQVWAVAPVINLSGKRQVDPILQADLLYQQLQAVQGLTVIPVDRTIQAMAALQIAEISSIEEALALCEALGVDGLIVTTITQYDPYNPPKIGAAMQLFRTGRAEAIAVDVNAIARAAADTAAPVSSSPLATGPMVQVVGMYDAANGSVRQAVLDYARGRNDPTGPLGEKEYFVSADRYAGFVYRQLLEQLLSRIYYLKPPELPPQPQGRKAGPAPRR